MYIYVPQFLIVFVVVSVVVAINAVILHSHHIQRHWPIREKVGHHLFAIWTVMMIMINFAIYVDRLPISGIIIVTLLYLG